MSLASPSVLCYWLCFVRLGAVGFLHGCGSKEKGKEACLRDSLTCLHCMMLAILHNVLIVFLERWGACTRDREKIL